MTQLHPDRLVPVEPKLRKLARTLYDEVRDLPIISPHGHTDTRWFAENTAFANPSELFVTPDHYVFRMLHSQGIALEDLGVPRVDGGAVEQDPRKIWQFVDPHIRCTSRFLQLCATDHRAPARPAQG